MALTPAQTDAKNARGRTLLVSAAAGSGKTYTLTRRIIDTIINDETRSIDRMLIVTFTRAAAGELKAKISKALTDAIAENPDNLHLRRQLLKLGGAKISTIDSFFSGPIRENFEKLGLPASMRMADDAELAPLRDGILRETLASFFSSHSSIEEGRLTEVGQSTPYTDLLGLITPARDSSALLPSLTKIYRKLTTTTQGVGQLHRHAERMTRSAEADFFCSAEGASIKNAAIDTVSHAKIMLEDCTDRIRRDHNGSAEVHSVALIKKYLACFEDDINRLAALLVALEKGYGETCAALDALKFKPISRLTADEKSEESEEYKNIRTKVLDPVKKLQQTYFRFSAEEISEQFKTAALLSDLLAEVLEEFDLRYSAEKLRRGVCEFSDMPKFMLRLLQNEDGTPSAFADRMAERFDEVYIDEYQDVNEIQDRIFELIGRDRRFMVGDIKQSIYGFREAEPSIFAAYRRLFPAYDRDNLEIGLNEGGSSIFMSNNFRCDETVVRFSNMVCSTVFRAFAESIGYTEKDDLIFTKDNGIEGYQAPRVVLNLIQPSTEEEAEIGDEDENIDSITDSEAPAADERYYDEAIVTANEIARLIRDENERTAKGKRITAGDIAILVRGHAQVKPITEALSRLGIASAAAGRSALLDSPEMKLLVDLLTVIDNPRSDVPLCRLLTADAGGLSPLFTLEQVIGIRKDAESSKTLFDALVECGERDHTGICGKLCREFVSQTEKMRHVSARLPADKLLRAIAQSDRYAPLCESPAYTYLYNCACKYVRQAWNGLYSFLTYFKNLLEKGESSTEPIKAQADQVTIMTIHQSKGLEFNVCFLFGLGKGFNVLDTRDALIFTRDFGLSMKLPPRYDADCSLFDKIRRRREDTALIKAAAHKIKRDLIEEEARIFYVALTRACERLYLSGTLKKPYRDVEKELLSLADLDYAVKHGRSYLDWTLLSAARGGMSRDFYEIKLFEAGKNQPDRPIMSHELEATEGDAAPINRHLAEVLIKRGEERHDEKLLATIPAKVAASKVSSKMLDDSTFTPLPTGKLFSEGLDGESEAGADSAIHIKNRIELMRSRGKDFDSLLAVNQKPTAAEKGTAAHLFLQYCDYDRISNAGIEAEIERLRQERFISDRTASILSPKLLASFFESDLFALIKDARAVHREFRFGRFKSAAEFTENEELKNLVADKKIFVQGSVDLLIETEDGELLLCDYKTDRISPEERADRDLLKKNMLEKHGAQLAQYCHAIGEIFSRRVSRVFIYSIPLGALIEME